VNRDNALFALMGIVVGFVAAYLLFEAMSVRQPALRPPGQAQAAAGAQGAAADAAGGQGGMGGQAASQQQVQELAQYVAEHPDDADAVLQLAGLNLQISNWGRGQELLEQYLELRPDDPNAIADLGYALRAQGQLDEALAQFRRAQEVRPGHLQSMFNEAYLLGIDLGEYDQALAVIGELRQAQPNNPDVERLAQEIERRRDAS
jgi:tetratricopeptide (TPR) repeat protein